MLIVTGVIVFFIQDICTRTVIWIALFKPGKVWQLGKIQGFVKLLGDTGVTILFLVIAIAALGGGILIILR